MPRPTACVVDRVFQYEELVPSPVGRETGERPHGEGELVQARGAEPSRRFWARNQATCGARKSSIPLPTGWWCSAGRVPVTGVASAIGVATEAVEWEAAE